MKSTFKKKPILLRGDADEAELQPWQVRTTDGQLRGPVGLAGLRSLLDVGILNRAAMIAGVKEDKWMPIGDHPVWLRIQPPPRQFKLRNAELMEAPVANVSCGSDTPVSQERMLCMEAARHRELEHSYQRVRWWQLGRVIRNLRELVVFLCFLTAGDLVVSFFGASEGLVKWGVLLFLTFGAVVYYTFRAIGR